MAKLYTIKNRFQLVQFSMYDPSGKPASMIFKKGKNENIPEWVLGDEDIKRYISEGKFKAVPQSTEEKTKKPIKLKIPSAKQETKTEKK
jgi:hypothetical protein